MRETLLDDGSNHRLRSRQEAQPGIILAPQDDNEESVLLGDPNCNVAALVENETRDWGIVGASGPLDNSLVDMNFIPRTSNLKPGQEVVTSGAGNIFTKKGIRIGKIADVRQVQFGIYGEAKVKLAVNLGALEEVWVLLP